MFLRKLVVIVIPLILLLFLCLLIPMLSALDSFFGSLLLGLLLGTALSLLLPLSGATRLREPFAWLLWSPSFLIFLVLLIQYLLLQGVDLPILRLLTVNDARIITLEISFTAYMIAFSIRTGRGI